MYKYRQEGTTIELSPRQLEIVGLVRQHAPITGEQIAEMLGATRPAIRSDLVLLGMLGYLDAKPKVGYFPGPIASSRRSLAPGFMERPVREVMGVPVVLRETASVSDAVVTLFLENVGSVAVIDEGGALAGIVSRKDLLKVAVGNAQSQAILLGMVMTRYPNVVTVAPDDTVLEALRRIIAHQVDGLPVVQPLSSAEAGSKCEAVGRITKTTIVRLLFESVVAEGEGEEI